MSKKTTVARVSNADIYGVLMDLKEDMGAVKQSTALHLEGLKNHGERITQLEGAHQRQKGAVKTWGLVATGVSTIVGGVIAAFKGH